MQNQQIKKKKMRSSATAHVHRRGEMGSSLEDYKEQKMYPHIADQYDFRINNRLLISKIIKPRRDKIIMDSLEHTSHRFCLKKKKIQGRSTRCLISQKPLIHQKQLRNNRKSRTEDLQADQPFATQQRRLQRVRIKRNMTMEDGQEIEEKQLKKDNQGIKEVKNIETRDSSHRNNFVGKIIKNIKNQNSFFSRNINTQLNQSQFDCDSSVSQYIESNQRGAHIKSQFILKQSRLNSRERSSYKFRIQEKQNYRYRPEVTCIVVDQE